MAFLRCEKPHWTGDDLSQCIRRDYLQVLFPILVAVVSAIVLFQSTIRNWFYGGRNDYRLIKDTLVDQLENETYDESEDDFAEHLSLRHTISHQEFELREDKPRDEIFRVVSEEVMLMALVGIELAFLFTNTGHSDLLVHIAGLSTWLYALAIASMRLLLPTSSVIPVATLWGHSATIYLIYFILACLPFRSDIIHPPAKTEYILDIVEFALLSCLVIIMITSRRGNKSVWQEKVGDLTPSQEPLASLFSLATFGWINPLIWLGYQRPLELSDVWNLRDDDLALNVLATFRQTKKTFSLALTLMKHFRWMLFIQAVWAVSYSLFTFAPTLLVRVILEYVQNPEDTPRSAAWLYVALLFITAFISSIGNAQALYIGRRICIRLRAIVVGEVYAKALRRKAVAGSEKPLGDDGKDSKKDGKKDKKDGKDTKEEPADGQASVGSIINLMAVDSQKVAEVCAYLHYLIAGVPVQIILAVILLYQILGWSSIVGISTMVLLLPINYLCSRQFGILQRKIMAATDKRILATNEVLTNIRIIKYFAWEERFMAVVNESRRAELKELRKRYILWAFAATVWYITPILITMLSFFSYTVLEKKDLNAPIAFTALSLFNVLRVPLDQLADMITNVLQTKVSVDRVQEFLSEEETEKYAQLRDDGEDHPLIGFEDGEFTWGSKTATSKEPGSAFTLRNLNIEFVPRELNIIAGPTGSGKTSLLMALLGEMTCLNGKVYLPGAHSREDLIPDADGLTDSVAYCAQQAWLVNATIKENILFASRYDEARYKAVLHACALERDLEILDNGDETEVGEKGITLSGGQKQRISLARALYSSSRHLLLDDCLSAVDSHTAKYINENCILGPLMKNRTCILVTHNLALCVPAAKFVVALNNGEVVATGPPAKVIATGALGSAELLKTSPSASQATTRVPSSANLDQMATADQTQEAEAVAVKASKKSNEETKTEGSVDWRVYTLYLKSMGPWYFWLFVVLVFVAQQLMTVASSVWIREWARQYEEEDISATGKSYFTRPLQHQSLPNAYSPAGSVPTPYVLSAGKIPFGTYREGKKEVNVGYYLAIYGLIGVAYCLLSITRELVVFFGSLKASRNLHKQLLESVLRAKFRFFDSTPIGRIMNRFSKDIEAIDQEVAPTALGMIHCIGSVIVIVALISAITPGFLLAGVLITVIYFFIGTFYLRASRDLKRIESIQKSPLYQHFGETLHGIATIRAYGDERRFIRENLKFIDTYNRPFFYLWVANRWLSYRVDLAGALVSFFAGVFVILNVGKIDAGLAGLSLTYAITFTDNILWVVRMYAMNEQNMNSVERIREYLQIDQEAPAVIPEKRPAAEWPQEGALKFENYSARYRPDLDRVLKDVSFTLQPHEKLGIVGRTGAGKSSLALALFRSLEADSGRILVDGVNIGEIGLKDLRRNITMVPQDPTLFTGTIRSNLDPFNLYTDDEIFRALERVELIPRIRGPLVSETTANKNIFLDLSSPVAESGNNLSQGQKQLLCLARALLRQPKIVVFDEATASIDYETDAKIQHAIRELESTTITIAHRLASIIYYDKVLVLDHGEVKEFAHPFELIEKEGSIFREMCVASGEFAVLVRSAKEAFEARTQVTASSSPAAE